MLKRANEILKNLVFSSTLCILAERKGQRSIYFGAGVALLFEGFLAGGWREMKRHNAGGRCSSPKEGEGGSRDRMLVNRD